MHRKLIALAAVVAAFAVAGTASAHVVVTPGSVRPDSFYAFDLWVPTEEAVPTTRVTLQIPDGVTVYSVQPVPGWRYSLTKVSGRITAITVKGKLPPEMFQRFSFLAATPKEETTLVWKAVQTYRNGKVVKWTDEPGAEEASKTTVSSDSTNEGL